MFPRQDRDTTGVYSRSGISGTGTTGRVVKIRLPGSISRATALNSPSPTASLRTDPAKSDVSAAENASSMSQGRLPVGLQMDTRSVEQHALSHQVAPQQPRT